MTVGWFPRFNPSGSLHTWERPGYWRAQFLTETTEIADNGTNLLVNGQPIAAPSCNELGAGGGVWAACRTDPVRVFTSEGRTIMGAGCPAVNPDGKIAYVDDRQGVLKNLIFDLEPVSRGAITDVRCSRTALVWRNAGWTWGVRLDRPGGAQEIQVAPEEFGPVPIDTPRGPWVLNYTQTGIILRPFGEQTGYRFDNGGQTYYPDAVYRDGGILAIFTNDRGEQSTQPFDLTAPRVPLGGPVDRQPGPVVHLPIGPAAPVTRLLVPVKEPSVSLPSLDTWIHVEFPQLLAAYIKTQGHQPEPDFEWAAFQTYRRFMEPEVWPFDKMLRHEQGNDAPVNPR